MNAEVFEKSLRDRAAKRRKLTGLVDDGLALALDEIAAAVHEAREAMQKQMESAPRDGIQGNPC